MRKRMDEESERAGLTLRSWLRLRKDCPAVLSVLTKKVWHYPWNYGPRVLYQQFPYSGVLSDQCLSKDSVGGLPYHALTNAGPSVMWNWMAIQPRMWMHLSPLSAV